MNGACAEKYPRAGWTAIARTWLPTALYVCCILVLALRPLPRLPSITHVDKYLHVVLYGVLAVLIHHAILTSRFRRSAVLALGATVLVGLLDEGLQLWGGVRRADAYDLLADSIGAVLGLIAAVAMRRAGTSHHRCGQKPGRDA